METVSKQSALVGVKLISSGLISGLKERAADSRRLRANHNFHDDPSENVHRFVNVLIEGTYVRPHRHMRCQRTETLIVLRGELALIVFDNEGAVVHCRRLSATLDEAGVLGFELAPSVWHTVVVLSNYAACFEIKPGPWEGEGFDKDFAPWSPKESDPKSVDYLSMLKARLTFV